MIWVPASTVYLSTLILQVTTLCWWLRDWSSESMQSWVEVSQSVQSPSFTWDVMMADISPCAANWSAVLWCAMVGVRMGYLTISPCIDVDLSGDHIRESLDWAGVHVQWQLQTPWRHQLIQWLTQKLVKERFSLSNWSLEWPLFQ